MAKIIVDACVFINAMKTDSVHREQCIAFLTAMAESNSVIAMPAHGWFEILCSLHRIATIENVFDGAIINDKWTFPVELIHIDANFISKYGNVKIPYTQSGDHIYLVVAYVNAYRLITTDNRMTNIAKQIGVSVYTPEGFLALGDVA